MRLTTTGTTDNDTTLRASHDIVVLRIFIRGGSILQQTLGASLGQEAVARAYKRPRALIADLHQPGRDGIAAEADEAACMEEEEDGSVVWSCVCGVYVAFEGNTALGSVHVCGLVQHILQGITWI